MIKIVCLVSHQEEIEYIKKRIQDAIFSSDILPHRQAYVMPGEKNRPMSTDNCHIDFRSPNPEKIGGLNADIVIGAFNCDYDDEIINMITGKSPLGLQKKYGDNSWEVWDIVLDIEERYAKAMEVMFND